VARTSRNSGGRRNPELGPEDVRKILTSSARQLGNANDFGSGLIDASKAIQTAGDFNELNITASTPPQPAPGPSRQRPPVVNVNHPGAGLPKPAPLPAR
jgi:hypothetical protein